MNGTLSARDVDALLEVLERGLVEIRLAAMSGQTKRAEAIADALHNVPRLLSEGQRHGWSVAAFRELFLAPLLAEHPDLVALQEPLDRR